MVLLRGTGVSGGIAAGRLTYLKPAERTVPRYHAADSEMEWRRFESARGEAVRQIRELEARARTLSESGSLGGEALQLLEAHEVIAMDPEFEAAVGKRIRQANLNAEAAVMDAADAAAEKIAAVEDDYIRARVADVKDVAQRIAAAMQGQGPSGAPAAPEGAGAPMEQEADVVPAEQESDAAPVILAADDLTPGETLRLDRTKIAGFITAGGSAAGHTAILARTMGIPAIIGIGSQLKAEYEGQEILMDGDSGEIVVAPDAPDRERFMGRAAGRRRELAKLALLKGRRAEAKDGRSIRLCCNISFPEDIPAVLDCGADGIGLFRSECLFLGRESAPSEEEQFEAYRRVLSAMDGRHVIIRTLDAGSDKQADYLGFSAEANPALGRRGIRFSLSRPDLFCVQLRALARASAYGSLGILFPMVSSLQELREAKKLWGQVLEDLRGEGIAYGRNTAVGIMIETPAAALISAELAKEADFFSIGTNDLTQYTLACDRQADVGPAVCDPHHPAVLRLIGMAAESARHVGIPVSVCGGLAVDRDMTAYFLSIGISELSVPPGDVLPLKEKILSL